jgi:hypothetical protein
MQHQGRNYLVTLDEAWLYFSNQHEQIWISAHDDTPTIERQTISGPKNNADRGMEPHGFHLVNVLSKGQK